MNSDPLDHLLQAYSQQPLPPPPNRLTSGVWREIELRRRRSWWLGIFPTLSWQELFAEPRLAVAGLAVALLAGVLPAAAARVSADAQLAQTSLHLDVFSAHSPGMPATLLTKRANMVAHR